MATSDIVKAMMDSFFQTMDLKSCNTYPKSGFTVVTLRFVNKSGNDSDPKTFVQKHPYHVKRDKERSEQFKQNQRPKRDRKQTQHFDASVENLRSDTCMNEQFSTPGIKSPCSIVEPSELNLSNDSFRLDSSLSGSEVVNKSPDLAAAEYHTESSSDNCVLKPVTLDSSRYGSPSLPPVQMTKDNTLEHSRNPKLPIHIDTPSFKSHCAEVPNWSLDSMSCNRCGTNIRDLTSRHGRMAYCKSSGNYICNNCVFLYHGKCSNGCSCTYLKLKYFTDIVDP